jgi:response regulator of citrate/malate metabolism
MKKEMKTVLIIDDSRLIIERILPVLGELEYISFVIHADNFKEGLEVLSRLTQDNVLLEIRQSDKDAIELLQLLRDRKTEVAILMVSDRRNRLCNDLCKRLVTLPSSERSQPLSTIPISLSAAG